MQRNNKSICHQIAVMMIGIVAAIASSPAVAGLSGENIVVVVNAASLRSRTIANHYIHAREIPSGNVILLKEVPDTIVIGMEDFKTKILKPVLDQINRRGIAKQARCIAYSGDFPTSVDISSHRERLPNAQAKKLMGNLASITGLTYFYRFVFGDNHAYLGFRANLYSRSDFDRYFINPFQGEKRETFNQAKKDLSEGNPAKAAESLKELFEEYPSLAPLAIQSAEAYSEAKDYEAATKMAKNAIKAGWWSADYFDENEKLTHLLADPELATAKTLLATHPTHVQGPMGFSSVKGWTDCGYPVRIDQGGLPYMMSCSLAVFKQHGSTLSQAISVLDRAVKADRQFPTGSFRFANNSDVRAKTRFPGIANVLLFMQDVGYPTEVFTSANPSKPGNVVGLMLGVASPSLKKTSYKLQPGAISETLTSLAGDFRNAGQTKLTEYLHAGAAMSSGAVMEPYALQPKFPTPMMHGYYASGATAIEAFYLSVASPYQLLIVGDPHCQPFARAPAAKIDLALVGSSPAKIKISRTDIPRKTRKGAYDEQHPMDSRPHLLEVYIEGRLVQELRAPKSVDMNLPGELSGAIEVRAVLTGLDPNEPRRSFRKVIDIKGKDPAPTGTITSVVPPTGPDDPADGSKAMPIEIELTCKGADSISVLHITEQLGTVTGESGKLSVDVSKLGGGPKSLRPVANFGATKVLGAPILLER